MESSSLLAQALRALPIGVLVVSAANVVVEMSQSCVLLLDGILSLHDDVKTKLIDDATGHPLEVWKKSEGYFKVDEKVYRFICGTIITNHHHETETSQEYRSVCVFDDTKAVQKLKNAEGVSRLLGAKARESSAEVLKMDKDMLEFEHQVAIDAGLGFKDDPNTVMVKYSPTGVVLQCNKALRGFPPDEIIGVLGYDHVHPDDIERVCAYNMSLLEDPRPIIPVFVTLRKKHKNGNYVHVEVIGTIHCDENGPLYSNCIERILLNERMETLLASVTDKIPCGLLMVDECSGSVMMTNRP
jgi:hypothetical protein